MVKIFVGNLDEGTTDANKLRSLFEQYGSVSECDVLSKYGFVVCSLISFFGIHRILTCVSYALILRWFPCPLCCQHGVLYKGRIPAGIHCVFLIIFDVTLTVTSNYYHRKYQQLFIQSI